MANTFLHLPPEMGGTRFGPFKSGTVVQIGTDQKCQIVLAATPGIAPVHVTITEHGDGYAISPVQRGFGLFMLQAGGGQVYPIASAVQGHAGDTIMLGSPGGPRFMISREETAVKGGGYAGPRAPGGRGGYAGGGMAGGVANELWRQTMARMMMRSPLYRTWYTLSFRYRTGSLNNPRVIVGVITALVAMVGAGTVSCGGIIAKLTHMF